MALAFVLCFVRDCVAARRVERIEQHRGRISMKNLRPRK
jgi:hypothetical protein